MLWLAGVVLLFDKLTHPAVIAGLLLFLATNFLAHRATSRIALFRSAWGRLVEWTRYLDVIGVAAVSLSSGLRADQVCVVGIPILICESIATRSRSRVAIMTGLLVLLQSTAALATGQPITSMFLAIGLYAVGAVAAVVLGGYRDREEVLASRDRRLAAILECGAELGESRDLRTTLLNTLRTAVHETGATGGYVMLLDEEGGTRLTTEAAYGPDGEFEFPERLEVGFGMTGFVARMGQPLTLGGGSTERRDVDGVGDEVRSACAVPLLSRGYAGSAVAPHEVVVGAMTLVHRLQADGFSADDLEMLRALASIQAVAVSNARMESRRRNTFLRTMESLASALEARDEYTQGHSQRVCEVSLMLGDKLGFGEDALEELRVGTMLHDIGKIGVPDAVLNKRGRLSAEEFAVMKQHPVIGYEICKPLLLSEGVLMIIRNHHEKLDGSGYPDGLKGGELPLSLRVVCVADAFDAMSSRRPYRSVMTPAGVLAELSRCAGTQFDPVVVEALKELMHSERMQELYRQYWRGEGEARAA